MKKILYFEKNFVSPQECEDLIKLSKENKEEIPYGNESRGGNTFLTTLDGIYFEKEDNNIVERVTNICRNFDERVIIDYAAVVRWPVGTFMKEHIDPSRPGQEPDLFAALVYLNDDFTGGYTQFEENVIKPEIGKLLVFSNSYYKHGVSKVEDSERFALSVWFNRK